MVDLYRSQVEGNPAVVAVFIVHVLCAGVEPAGQVAFPQLWQLPLGCADTRFRSS